MYNLNKFMEELHGSKMLTENELSLGKQVLYIMSGVYLLLILITIVY